MEAVSSIKPTNDFSVNPYSSQNSFQNSGYDKNLFDNNIRQENAGSVEYLEERLDEISDKNGIFTGTWNNIKEVTNLGTSEEKCNEAIEKYKNGEITFDEASNEIERYGKKQDIHLDVVGNIAASVLAIAAGTAVTLATGGTAAPLAAAIITGAVAKAGLKASDRATNEVKGDAGDLKQIAKDGLSGAVTGGTAFITAGTGEGAFAAGGIKNCATASCKTGLKTGAVAGGSNYVIDCAFDEDKDFDIKEFGKSTAFGSITGGTVGLIMGSANGILRYNGVLQASDSNIVSNCASTASYKITGERVRALAS